ncbi:hypothetical protein P152DRAFT_446348 [Eremomyces bilateralis CBS 781.70]|uniref:Uncharacterized protein n=1 Tax=Eremomyces bilateralis CBS 781.70 TaxID=1392243 RepID=A0A6G1GFA5_9PEZI|nr:uncharacterized protein P152DRAFT_446348 [Eremomyces bilateralis CBS 781.70]KAF1816733.1 hypothetical protein P152DRAFT_446348 [Eremomyces bilateralis CBS 781.70]
MHYTAKNVRAFKKKDGDACQMLVDVRNAQVKKKTKTIINLPERNNLQETLEIFCDGAPKLRYLLLLIVDKVVKGQKKMMIWVNPPAQQIWLEKILRMVGLDFPDFCDGAKPIRTMPFLRLPGARVQPASRRPSSPPTCLCGEEHWVQLVRLLTHDSFNTQQHGNQIVKSLAGLMASLNMLEFGDES